MEKQEKASHPVHFDDTVYLFSILINFAMTVKQVVRQITILGKLRQRETLWSQHM